MVKMSGRRLLSADSVNYQAKRGAAKAAPLNMEGVERVEQYGDLPMPSMETYFKTGCGALNRPTKLFANLAKA